MPSIRIGIWLLLICAIGYCFTTAEVEIFQLQQELVKKYGSNIDFYRFLKLPNLQGSTAKEITKNFRKLSKKYHPDKNKKFKKLYSRLNIATQVLSNENTRKTYDYYLKHGFPDYDFGKGGFFFRRVQPKTWFILLFVYTAASLIHYVLLKTQVQSQRKRIQFFIDQVKSQDDTHGLGEKNLTFQQHAEDEPKRITIRYGDVLITEDDGAETPISPDTILEPGVLDTLFFRLPWIFIKPFVKPFQSDKKQEKSSKSEKPKKVEKESTNGDVQDAKPRKSATTKSNQKVLPNGKVLTARKKK